MYTNVLYSVDNQIWCIICVNKTGTYSRELVSVAIVGCVTSNRLDYEKIVRYICNWTFPYIFNFKIFKSDILKTRSSVLWNVIFTKFKNNLYWNFVKKIEIPYKYSYLYNCHNVICRSISCLDIQGASGRGRERGRHKRDICTNVNSHVKA